MRRGYRHPGPSSLGSGVECASIDGGFQSQSLLFGSRRGDIGSLEPAVFFDLMVSNRAFPFFGAHHDHSLVLAFDFSGLTPDEELADIKFSHYYLPMDDELLLFGALWHRLLF
jgi:hypothetical protein